MTTGPAGCRRPRRGYGLIELAICTLLIAVAMGLMAQAVSWVAAERLGADRRQAALQEAANQIERLASRPYHELTAAVVGGVVLSESARSILPGATIEARIDEAAGDVQARRITVEVSWRDRAGGRVAPVRLVAWVHRRGGAGT